jgi:cyclophilin family peptidyl-prolyl cis-trans isomerase
MKHLFPIAAAAFLMVAAPLTAQDNKVEKTAAKPVVVMETNMGTMEITLNPERAPISCRNFLAYVKESFYDSTIFHRVISGFMIQGGGFVLGMDQKTTKPPIKNEAGNGLKNTRGTIAMARTSVINSATCQFFINHVDNAALDHKDDTPQGFGYAVFGEVTKGMEVVDAIAAVQTGAQDVPKKPVVILKVTLKETE